MQSLGWAGVVKITSKWFSYRRYGTAMAIISLSYLFGDALARRFLASLIAGDLSWREIFVVAAVMLAVMFLVCVGFLRESPTRMGIPEPPANPANLFGEDGDRPAPKSLQSLLRPLLRSTTFLGDLRSFGRNHPGS